MRRALRIAQIALSVLIFTVSAGAVTTGCAPGAGGGRGCCRVCTTGKPCGNTCIARNLTCRTPGGCACYGSIDLPDVLMAPQLASVDLGNGVVTMMAAVVQ